MKKALLIVLVIIAGCFILGNLETISSIWDATQRGATMPLVLAVVLMLARHIVQAVSYKAAFEAVDFSGPKLWDYVVLIFSLVFINTFCLFSGATGVAFIIDDAHRKGADIGKSTSGAILSQIGYFAAVFVISIIGFTTMIISGNINWVFVTGAAILAGTLIALSSMYLVGYFRPAWLYSLFNKLAGPITAVTTKIKRPVKPTWGNDTAESFINAARVMAQNPAGTATSIAWASLSALLNMSCLVAIGFSFGFNNVAALVAAFALGAISVVVSPTPQGIGVVEAAIAAVLTANGCSLATATAIALVYRGIMFWIPFVIGAALLSQSGFFQSKKDATEQQKAKDVAWISGTLVGIIGIVNIGLNIIPAFFSPYSQLVEWVDFHELFAGPSILMFGILCLVLAFGLIKRYRIVWAFTTALLVLIAGVEFLFYQTIPVAIASILLVAWLMWKRNAFDQDILDPTTRLGRGLLAFLGEDAPSGTSENAVVQARLAGSADVARAVVRTQRLSARDIASEIEDIEAGRVPVPAYAGAAAGSKTEFVVAAGLVDGPQGSASAKHAAEPTDGADAKADSDEVNPDEAASDEVNPDEVNPDEVNPDEAISEEPLSEDALLDEAVSGEAALESESSNEVAQEGTRQNDDVSDDAISDDAIPEGDAADEQPQPDSAASGAGES